MNNSLRGSTLAMAVAASLALASAANATIIASDPFTFANGSGTLSQSGNNNDNSAQWGGNWSLVAGNDGTYYAGSLSAPASATAYTEIPTGNAVLMPTTSSSGSSSDDGRKFSTALTGTVWVSFLIQPQLVNGRLQGLSLYTGTDGNTGDLIDIGSNGEANSAAPAADWQTANQTTAITQTPNWGINGATGSSAIVNASDATPVSLDTTALLVAEINLSSGTAYLWVNPTSSTDFNNTADTTNGPYEALSGLGTSSTIGSLRIFSGGYNSGYGGNAEDIYDELRIGTSEADVVPEPASCGLASATGMLGLMRRRRRVLTV